MRLRRPCEHDRYEAHYWPNPVGLDGALCPGGEFLPEDAKQWACISQYSGVFASSLPGWCRATNTTRHDPGCGMYYLVPAADQVGEPS